MNLSVTSRQTMIIAGLLQGAAMLLLHEWFLMQGFRAADLVWVAPAYAVAVFGPLTFNFLRSEFSVGQSLRGALVAAIAIGLTACWFGWSLSAGGDTAQLPRPEFGSAFVFGAASVAVWFVALPFVQAGLRNGSLVFPYASLFDDAWRNTLLAANCLAFAGVFWALLGLWAGLFLVLHMAFFKDLFTSRFFIYLATAMAISFAVSLEEKEASALGTLRRYLLVFQTRLLPLAALIVILFLAALPAAGLESVWGTGHATPLMLCLQLVVIALTNAAWQDGAQPAPFSLPMQWLTRIALVLLPILSGLCVWSLSLRVGQYGWSIDRVWAAILVGLTSLYALGYAGSALQRGWLPLLGTVNTWMALLLIGTLLATHTPLLDSYRISSSSQVSRLLSGASDVDRFDFNYLRFGLGRAGDEALRSLSELAGHPKAEAIRAKAKEALARTNRFAPKVQPIPDKKALASRLKPYPVEARIPADFVDYLHERLASSRNVYPLNSLKSGQVVQVLAIDLGADPAPELVLMAAPYPMFTHAEGKWRQIGQMNFPGYAPRPDVMDGLLESGQFSAVPRSWADMRLGDRFGVLMLQTERSGE